MDAAQQELVAQFCAVTGANPAAAQTALASANWNLEEAVALYFAAHDEPQDHEHDFDYEDEAADDQTPISQPLPPAPIPTSSSASGSASTSRKPPTTSRPKQMTMDELRKRNEDAHSPSSDDENKRQDMFAGGEKSGLAVQNPGQTPGEGGPTDHFRNIMNQARQNRDRPAATADEEGGAAEGAPPSSNFTGRAQTLGGDEAESRVIEDPFAEARSRAAAAATERVTRTLHLWADGISIDEGPLFRFDDPANAAMMAEINRGRAPLQLLDVRPDQEVDLNLEPHRDENYVQPKKKYKPFGGSGQRLGSPTPSAGAATSSSTTTTTAAPPATTAAAASSASTPAVDVDASQPTIQLQIRLADGTRLSSRFNTTHTIGDVYAFVDRASPAVQARPYALMTTFPSKELEDRSQVLGEMGEFKRGGVVVVKWK